jgi:hypothetical protein
LSEKKGPAYILSLIRLVRHEQGIVRRIEMSEKTRRADSHAIYGVVDANLTTEGRFNALLVSG